MLLPILYSFRRCPYAMRARLAIQSANIQLEIREVVLKNKPAELLFASPKATVPVLVLPDRQVIDESRDIMLWALEQQDSQAWLACPLSAANTLIDQNDNEFKPQLDGYKYADRRPQSSEFYRQQADDFLHYLEQRLSKQKYLLAEQISIADMAIFPFIRQFAQVDLDWFNAAPYPYLRQWLNGFLAAEWFAGIMKKYPPWQPEATVQRFP